MRRTTTRALAALATGTVVLGATVVAGAAPVPLDQAVGLDGHTWTITNEGGFDDATPPECEGQPALAVEDATTPGNSDAFDEAYLLTVGGTVLADGDGTVDRRTEGADEVLTADPVALAGLEVTVQYRVFDGGDVLRQLVTLTNPGGAPVATPVAVHHNWGSDDDTEVHASESGDRVLDAGDRWVITTESDPATPGERALGRPDQHLGALRTRDRADLAVVGGAPPRRTTVPGQEGLTATFDVTVPAGSTRHLVFFGRISDPDEVTDNDEAVTNLSRVYGPMSTTSPLWAGIDAAQQAAVLNWATQVPPSTTTTTAPTTSTTAAPTTTVAVVAAAVVAQPRFTG